MRVAEWYQKVIQSDRIFNLHWTTIMHSFSCIHFFQQLYLSLNMCNFINLTLKYLYLRPRNVWLGSYHWCWNTWQKITSNTDNKISKRHTAWESPTTTPPHVRWDFLALISDTEIKFLSRKEMSSLMRLWHFSSFLTHSSNAHAQPSSGARCLIFGQAHRLLPHIMCANSEGSGETAQARLSLCWSSMWLVS